MFHLKHHWGHWQEEYTNKFISTFPKFEFRKCLKCDESERRDMPPLIERILEIGDLEHFQEQLDKLREIYGVYKMRNATRLLTSDKLVRYNESMKYSDYLKSAEKRNKKIEEMHKSGMSKAEIGRKVGISRERVRQVLSKLGYDTSKPLDK